MISKENVVGVRAHGKDTYLDGSTCKLGHGTSLPPLLASKIRRNRQTCEKGVVVVRLGNKHFSGGEEGAKNLLGSSPDDLQEMAVVRILVISLVFHKTSQDRVC